MLVLKQLRGSGAFRILFLFFITSSFAQKKYNSLEYRVSEGDLVNTSYENDSTANALVIFEHGKSYVTQRDYNVITEYKKKVKILKRNGFDEATVKIFLYKNSKKSESVREIIATTYTKVDGKVEITKLDKKNIYKEDYNEHLNLVTFTLPNIKVGSVITYGYKFESPFIFNYKNWKFQEEVPKLYSEYKTSIPAIYDYSVKLIGTQKLDVNTSEVQRECFTHGTASADCSKSVYIMKNIPAFVAEKYMTTKNNYLSKIEYELQSVKGFDGSVDHYTKSWKSVDKELKSGEEIGKLLRKTSVLKNLLAPSVITLSDPLEKAKEIYKYVRNTYSWNDEYKIFTDLSLKRLVKEKSGNVAEINGLLHNLLKKNGIETNPVLLSTRKNGLATKLFPVLSEFNYVIVRVLINDKEYLLDATDKYLTFGQVPFRCLNEYGRMLDFKEGSEWLPISASKTSRTIHKLDLKFEDASKIKGTLQSRYSGYHAFRKKKNVGVNKDAYIEAFENNNPNIEVDSHVIENDGKESENFQELFHINYENTEELVGKLYLDPMFLKFFKENPFKLQKRSYPIDFGYKDSYTYILNLDIGDLFEVVETPKNAKVRLPNNTGSFAFMTTTEGSIVQLILTLRFNRAVYSSEYYEGLKELMNHVVQAEMKSVVVLKKR